MTFLKVEILYLIVDAISVVHNGGSVIRSDSCNNSPASFKSTIQLYKHLKSASYRQRVFLQCKYCMFGHFERRTPFEIQSVDLVTAFLRQL